MRVYGIKDALNEIPRMIISMNIYESPFEVDFNHHYSLDTNLPEALEHFFRSMQQENPKAKIDINRSKLDIRYIDLPKYKGAVVISKENEG